MHRVTWRRSCLAWIRTHCNRYPPTRRRVGWGLAWRFAPSWAWWSSRATWRTGRRRRRKSCTMLFVSSIFQGYPAGSGKVQALQVQLQEQAQVPAWRLCAPWGVHPHRPLCSSCSTTPTAPLDGWPSRAPPPPASLSLPTPGTTRCTSSTLSVECTWGTWLHQAPSPGLEVWRLGGRQRVETMAPR